jgi:PhoH-like ATPase
MKKTYCVDTSSLIQNPNLLSLLDGDILIPSIVLEELDKIKHRDGASSKQARIVIKRLLELCKQGNIGSGVKNSAGNLVKIPQISTEQILLARQKLSSSFDVNVPDNHILFTAALNDAIVVTEDLNLAVKCNTHEIATIQQFDASSEIVEDFYTGIGELNIEPDVLQAFIEAGELDLSLYSERVFYPNQILIVKCGVSSLIAKVCDNYAIIIDIDDPESVHGLRPRNKEQKFALHLLLDTTIELVTMTASAGCGKTLLAIAAGLDQLRALNEHGKYEKMIVIRPIHPVGKDLGYMPGTFEEKMEPWISPIRDNFEFLTKNKNRRGNIKKETYLDHMFKMGHVEIEAITFLRGRSVPNAYIIVDECQNISKHEMKTILSRAGEGTKIVCTGDIDQIDNSGLNSFTNGLSHAVENFKNIDLAGHVTLRKGERSKLATIASKVL